MCDSFSGNVPQKCTDCGIVVAPRQLSNIIKFITQMFVLFRDQPKKPLKIGEAGRYLQIYEW